jgi:Sulfotransferase domain
MALDDSIIIVSGLPRCGTSMMMQMLEAGGISIVSDHIRKPDEDNPRGYYEFEKVKEIKKNSGWLNDCLGKAFKIVSALLYDLPKDRKYKVIFMERNLEEMIASQNVMLDRQGIKHDGISDQDMAKKFEKHLRKIAKWLANQRNIDTIYINYNEAIQNPHENAKRVNNFLGNRLNVNNMINVVEKSLYRQKTR